MEGKKIEASILPLARDLRVIERRRSKKQWKLKKTLGWAGIPLSQGVARRGRRRRLPLIQLRQWVPQLKSLKWARTSIYGFRMDSTKKEELLVEISTFQKVYILLVSETSKMVSRFCVKRLFYPYQWQSGVQRSRMETEQIQKLSGIIKYIQRSKLPISRINK